MGALGSPHPDDRRPVAALDEIARILLRHCRNAKHCSANSDIDEHEVGLVVAQEVHSIGLWTRMVARCNALAEAQLDERPDAEIATLAGTASRRLEWVGVR